jgi:hypothetical protein
MPSPERPCWDVLTRMYVMNAVLAIIAAPKSCVKELYGRLGFIQVAQASVSARGCAGRRNCSFVGGLRDQPEVGLPKVFALLRRITVRAMSQLRTDRKQQRAPFSSGSLPRATYGSENPGPRFQNARLKGHGCCRGNTGRLLATANEAATPGSFG